jgi:hypothetical protein
MLHRVVLFVRPTFVALVVFGLLAGLVNLLWLLRDDEAEFRAGGLSASDLKNVDLSEVVLPHAHLSPAEVVRLQLAGLAHENADGVGILQCYAFASPANRAVTGPLDRFGRMVRQQPYDCMARPRALLVGRPEHDKRVARVLVTVMGADSQVHAFTFVLGRQQEAPFANCWMTEAVLASLPTTTPEAPPATPRA